MTNARMQKVLLKGTFLFKNFRCPCLSIVDAPCAKYMTVAYTEYKPNHVTYGKILMSFFASLIS